jgi:Transcriptional regulatory protein, C terminal
MALVWGLLTQCSVTAQLIREIFATYLPAVPLQVFSSEQEAKRSEAVQAWIWDEVALEAWRGWKGPCLFLGAPPLPLLEGLPLGGEILEKPFQLGPFLKYLQQLSQVFASVYTVGPYRFHPKTRALQAQDGRMVVLREKEAELLLFLLQSPGGKADKQTILQQVWDYHPQVLSHTLETHIYQLRQKLEVDPSCPAILVNEGAVYQLVLK